MSPSDRYFLQSLGIAPEEIAPAGPVTCPNCGGKRHRLGNVALICLSCAAREKREAARQEALAIANEIRAPYRGPRPNYLEMAKDALAAYRSEHPVHYRGYEVEYADGQGWRFRPPGGSWVKAPTYTEAKRAIERLAGPDIADFALPERVDNECRGCGAPCGHHFWCRSCGLDKFGRR